MTRRQGERPGQKECDKDVSGSPEDDRRDCIKMSAFVRVQTSSGWEVLATLALHTGELGPAHTAQSPGEDAGCLRMSWRGLNKLLLQQPHSAPPTLPSSCFPQQCSTSLSVLSLVVTAQSCSETLQTPVTLQAAHLNAPTYNSQEALLSST